MEISGLKVLNRFIFKRCIPILVGEQNLLSKTFICCVINWLLLDVKHIEVKGFCLT